MPRFLLAGILISAFALVAVFGFALMPQGYTHILCPAEQMQGKECPVSTDPLALLSFHVGALKAFAAGIFGASSSFAYALIFVVLSAFIASAAGAAIPFLSFLPGSSEIHRIDCDTDKSLLRWFSLHENSPNAF